MAWTVDSSAGGGEDFAVQVIWMTTSVPTKLFADQDAMLYLKLFVMWSWSWMILTSKHDFCFYAGARSSPCHYSIIPWGPPGFRAEEWGKQWNQFWPAKESLRLRLSSGRSAPTHPCSAESIPAAAVIQRLTLPLLSPKKNTKSSDREGRHYTGCQRWTHAMTKVVRRRSSGAIRSSWSSSCSTWIPLQFSLWLPLISAAAA